MKKTRAVENINNALVAIPELQRLSRDSQEFKIWRRDTRIALGYTFGKDSENVKEFRKIRYSPVVASMYDTGWELQNAYIDGLNSASAILRSMLNEVNQYWEDNGEQSDDVSTGQVVETSTTNRVFIVHGRDEGTKDSTARFLTDLQLDPVVLQEMPNQGRTIIEKFEDYSDVGFAVVLFTPDDEGGLAGNHMDVKPRTRQNVIFELGFFLGRLGRNRVAVLVKNDVEIPSDYSGVLFIQLDDQGAWKMQLIRELKSAGYSIDANRAFPSQ